MTWTVSDEAAAAAAHVHYYGAGPWDPGSCATTVHPHAQALATLLRNQFPWIREIGALRCSPNGSQLSIHAVGRALDVMVPAGHEDDAAQLADYLVQNAGAYGVQLVIYDHSVWQGSLRTPFGPYGGPNPHTDHVHVEVTLSPGESIDTRPSAAAATSRKPLRALGVFGGIAAGLAVAGGMFAAYRYTSRRRRRRNTARSSRM